MQKPMQISMSIFFELVEIYQTRLEVRLKGLNRNLFDLSYASCTRRQREAMSETQVKKLKPKIRLPIF